MIIRSFKNSDLDKIMEFNYESNKISFPNYEFDGSFFKKNILSAETGSVLVAEEDGKIAGYIYVKIKKLSSGVVGIIQHVFVDPKFRGNGLATRLIKKGFKYFRSKNVKRIRSTVTLANETSLKMIRKLGFEEKRIVMEKMLD